MKIDILFFASLREAVGRSGETLELPQACSVGQLRKLLAERGGDWNAMAEGRAVRAAVDQQMVGPDHLLADGNEVAFFPPVTGG